MIRNNLPTLSLSRTSMSASHASPHIFIIEKNPGIAEMITWMLELAGYHSIRSLGELPIPSQIPSADLPSLILLDVGLLRESVGQILTDLQVQYASIGITPLPIIILTTNPVVQKEAEVMGYRTVLKPFRIHDLTQAVCETLCLSHLRCESL